MTLGNAIREVASLVDKLEAEGVTVEDVDVGRADENGVPVSLQLRLSGDALDVEVETPAHVSSPNGEPGTDDDGTNTREPEPANAEADCSGGSADAEADRGKLGTDGEVSFDVSAGNADDESRPTGADGGPLESADDCIPCRVSGCEETFDTEHGMKIHAAKSHDVAESGGDQPHRDPARLREVYAEYETFDEMRDALGADVTAQTVRRNMMKHGIHRPDGQFDSGVEYAGESDSPAADSPPAADQDESERAETGSRAGAGTAPEQDSAGALEDAAATERTEEASAASGAGEASAESEVEEASAASESAPETVADADSPSPSITDIELPEKFSLPDDITLADVVEAVETSDTLFGVQRTLGLDRPTVQELLATLDLLELVHGRVQTKHERDRGKEAIVARISEAMSNATRTGRDDAVSRRDELSADD